MSSAATSIAAQTAGRLRGWLSVRHALRSEAVVVVALYGVYELARGLVVGDAAEAQRHARQLVAVERSLHLFVETNVQDFAQALPGLTDLLRVAYLTLHLAVTAGVLLWLHQRRPAVFPFVRTTLLLASGLALLGFLVYPTAPPWSAGISIADTVSNGHVGLNSGLVSSLYNPYAAVPSMHIGYALVVAASLLRHGGCRLVRALGVLYPPAVLLIVVATGNHFFFDAAAGAAVACVAFALTAGMTDGREATSVSRERVGRGTGNSAGRRGALRIAAATTSSTARPHDPLEPCALQRRDVGRYRQPTDSLLPFTAPAPFRS